jgi:membrane protease YdiL (CAAX protease family)
MSLIARLRWPIRGLGLGTPANLAFLSPVHRTTLKRLTLISLLIGMMSAFAVLAADYLLFGGESLQRVKAAGALPFGRRILIVVISSLAEEAIYRLGIATLVASIAFLALRKWTPHAATVAMWLGILVASLLFGLAHVGNAPGVPHPYLRAIALNGTAGVVLGWLYWYRGLEACVLAHLGADIVIYFGVASVL